MTSMIPAIIPLPKIQEYLKKIDLIPLIEQGFVAYSMDEAVVPPPVELLFNKPRGETHIKYGYIKNQPYYVVKIASGFYDNPKLDLRSSQGLMLLFSQQTGKLKAILLDEGYLTDVRTAVASMITLKYLAPKHVNCIGIIGSGIQAHLQLTYLQQVCNCKNIMVWNRNIQNALSFKVNFENSPYQIEIASSISELTQKCNIIITTTPSITPLLKANQIKRGSHITAIGSDTVNKTELSPAILKKADIVVSDSIAQSHSRGEVFQARKQGYLNEDELLELGHLICHPRLGRINDQQITVADLTGVAVQDISIATSIFNYHKNVTR